MNHTTPHNQALNPTPFKRLTKEEENTISDHLAELTNSVNWDNYQTEDVDDDDDATSTPYKLGEVLYQQLEWIRENLPENDDTAELFDYITTMQDHMCPIISILDPE